MITTMKTRTQISLFTRRFKLEDKIRPHLKLILAQIFWGRRNVTCRYSTPATPREPNGSASLTSDMHEDECLNHAGVVETGATCSSPFIHLNKRSSCYLCWTDPQNTFVFISLCTIEASLWILLNVDEYFFVDTRNNVAFLSCSNNLSFILTDYNRWLVLLGHWRIS